MKDFRAAEGEIREELERVLSGAAFSSSQRSSEFLRYVVEETLSGRSDQIKERSIAMAIFKRGAEYEPGVDSGVRVKGVEVRKRLAKHYSAAPGSRIRIELPQGHYVPTFKAPDIPPPAATRDVIRPAAAGLFICGIAALVWLFAGHSPVKELDDLWRPMTASKAAVLIGLPSALLYTVPGPATTPVPPEQVTKVADFFLGTGAAYGAAQVAAMLTARGGRFVVKVGRDVSYEDLKNQPAVFLGATSSPWTMEFSRKLRFEFHAEGNKIGVIDTQKTGQRWMRRETVEADVVEDYALVARIFDGSTGNPVLLVGGCGPRGTHAASEFVSSTDVFKQFTSVAPPDWPRRNFEVVLHAEVHGAVPGRPQVIAWHVW